MAEKVQAKEPTLKSIDRSIDQTTGKKQRHGCLSNEKLHRKKTGGTKGRASASKRGEGRNHDIDRHAIQMSRSERCTAVYLLVT